VAGTLPGRIYHTWVFPIWQDCTSSLVVFSAATGGDPDRFPQHRARPASDNGDKSGNPACSNAYFANALKRVSLGRTFLRGAFQVARDWFISGSNSSGSGDFLYGPYHLQRSTTEHLTSKETKETRKQNTISSPHQWPHQYRHNVYLTLSHAAPLYGSSYSRCVNDARLHHMLNAIVAETLAQSIASLSASTYKDRPCSPQDLNIVRVGSIDLR
jgi:hypothetical protein